MSDCYTPTDGEVLEAWAAHNTPDLPTALDLVEAYDAFKRWLAEHDAQVRADALREAAEEMDEIEANAEIAEFAAYVEGETSRQSVIDAAAEMQKDTAQWLRNRADRIEREAGQS